MSELILKMSVSLDGFVGGPNREVDWVFRSLHDDVTEWNVAMLWSAGVHVMGRNTYDDMAGYWPCSTEPFAPAMNDTPKVVFSRSLRQATWTQSRVASGELADEIAQLKRQTGKDILAHGGARFAQSLSRLGLIDEYRLVIHPVALGRGLPMFADLPRAIDLRLVSTTRFRGGAVAHVYRST